MSLHASFEKYRSAFYIILLVTFFMTVAFSMGSHLHAEEGLPASDIYIVTTGDTLWNICAKFFGDPHLWPALWQINPHIKDPHWIYPGEIINLKRFPSPAYADISVTPPPPKPPKKEEVIERVPEEEVIQEAEVVEKVKEVPGVKTPVYTLTQDKIDSCSYLLPQKVFHQREKEEIWGKIIDSKEDKISFSYMDQVYIDLGKNKVAPGLIMTIFKIDRDLKGQKKLEMPHYLVRILGKIKIVEVNDDFSLALITKSYSEISIGDYVKPYEAMPLPVIKPAAVVGMEGEILESENFKTNLAEYDTVFLNIGKWDGLEPGNPLEIYRYEDIKTGPKQTQKVFLPLGELLVIRGEEWTSTALITKSYRPIFLGDRVRVHQEKQI